MIFSQCFRPLRKRLETRTTALPPANSIPFFYGGTACGWASPQVAQALQEAGLATTDQTDRLELPASAQVLQAAAFALQNAGLLKGWRHESLDVLGPEDQVLGQIERAAMRPLGLRTRAVHLQATAPDQRIWIARRAAHKNTDPGLWDTLVGGLVGSGEKLESALLRESNEEAGLVAADLAQRQSIGQFLVTREVPEGYQVEATWVWHCVLPPDCQPRNLDGEVDTIELASIPEVLRAIEADEFTTEAALSILLWLEQQTDGMPT